MATKKHTNPHEVEVTGALEAHAEAEAKLRTYTDRLAALASDRTDAEARVTELEREVTDALDGYGESGDEGPVQAAREELARARARVGEIDDLVESVERVLPAKYAAVVDAERRAASAQSHYWRVEEQAALDQVTALALESLLRAHQCRMARGSFGTVGGPLKQFIGVTVADAVVDAVRGAAPPVVADEVPQHPVLSPLVPDDWRTRLFSDNIRAALVDGRAA